MGTVQIRKCHLRCRSIPSSFSHFGSFGVHEIAKIYLAKELHPLISEGSGLHPRLRLYHEQLASRFSRVTCILRKQTGNWLAELGGIFYTFVQVTLQLLLTRVQQQSRWLEYFLPVLTKRNRNLQSISDWRLHLRCLFTGVYSVWSWERTSSSPQSGSDLFCEINFCFSTPVLH